MFLQVEVPAEPFAADVTRERFLVVVRVHVKRQIVHLFGMKKQSTVILPEEVVTGFGWVAQVWKTEGVVRCSHLSQLAKITILREPNTQQVENVQVLH